MFEYPNLVFPQANLKLEKENHNIKVFDTIRKKFVVLTPEEWVRQHLINYLIDELKYPKGLMQIERQHQNTSGGKRTDVVAYDRTGKPFLLIECKAPYVKSNQNTLLQLSVYNKVIKAQYIAITNGLHHFCCKIEYNSLNDVHYLDTFPPYPKY